MFLVKLNFATPTPFGSLLFFRRDLLSNDDLNLFLIHQASYSKGYQWYLMHREVLGSIWKIGRYPIKVSEVLDCYRSTESTGSIIQTSLQEQPYLCLHHLSRILVRLSMLEFEHVLSGSIFTFVLGVLTLKAPITTAADDKFCHIISNFEKATS